jgi:hypothetical protein
MACDVFVSHSVKDKAVAEAIVARLEADSVTCWIAPRDVVPGADWGESIINAIESSRIMILIFSKSANASPQIKREVERAVNKGVYIIPFRVDDIPPARSLEYFISTSQWMDAFSPPLERHLENLAKTVKAVLKTPPLPGANVVAQSETQSPMAAPRTFDVSSSAAPRSSRPVLRGKYIGVAIAALMIVGAAGWYLGHQKDGHRVTPANATENESPVTSKPETDVNQDPAIANQSQQMNAASKEIGSEKDNDDAAPAKGLASKLAAMNHSEPDINQALAITKKSQQENEPAKQIASSETMNEPSSLPPQRGPWLFPDSSSRYLTATELSNLSSADLWRARNEIFARRGYKFSSSRGVAFARTLGNYYRGVDDNQDRVFNSMNQYEQANITLIQSIETGR